MRPECQIVPSVSSSSRHNSLSHPTFPLPSSSSPQSLSLSPADPGAILSLPPPTGLGPSRPPSLCFPGDRPSRPLLSRSPRRSLALPVALSPIRFGPSSPLSLELLSGLSDPGPHPISESRSLRTQCPLSSPGSRPWSPRPAPFCPAHLEAPAAQLGAGPARSPTPRGPRAAQSGRGGARPRGRWPRRQEAGGASGEAGGGRREAAAAALSPAAQQEGGARQESAAGLRSAASAARRPGPGPMPAAPPDRP